MRATVRYGITAAIALGGLSVVVAAPAAPPLRDIEVPAVQLSGNTADSPDATSPSVADLLQVMYGGLESPVVVQNITEPPTGSTDGDQPSNVPGLSDLLNLGNDPVGASGGQAGKAFVDISPLTPGDVSAVPANPPPPGS
jgi:hypothetical protein